MKKLRTAVIGVGNMGRHHARILSEISTLVAISDSNEARAKEISDKYGCKSYSDYNTMLDNEQLDHVSIVVPTHLHKKVTLDVVGKKINALLEKPIATNIEDTNEIYEAVKNSGVKFTVGHVERFNPAVIKLKEILNNGELGEILSIMARRVGTAGSPVSYENIIVDLAIHDIDVVNFLLNRDRPDNAARFIGKSKINNREDYADILMRHGNTNVMIQVNWITPIKIRVLSINGSKAYAELNYITQDLKVYKIGYIKEYDNFGKFVLKYSKPDEVNIKVEKDEPLKVELKSFLDCIKNWKQPEVTIGQSMNALKTALELLRENGHKEVL
jgi:UDP-N-acetylglucosamine 3-dehydrogenase